MSKRFSIFRVWNKYFKFSYISSLMAGCFDLLKYSVLSKNTPFSWTESRLSDTFTFSWEMTHLPKAKNSSILHRNKHLSCTRHFWNSRVVFLFQRYSSARLTRVCWLCLSISVYLSILTIDDIVSTNRKTFCTPNAQKYTLNLEKNRTQGGCALCK